MCPYRHQIAIFQRNPHAKVAFEAIAGPALPKHGHSTSLNTVVSSERRAASVFHEVSRNLPEGPGLFNEVNHEFGPERLRKGTAPRD